MVPRTWSWLGCLAVLHELATQGCWAVSGAAAEPIEVWLAAILPFTGGVWDTGISLRIGAEIMLEQIGNHSSLLPNVDLKVVWQDGRCNRDVSEDIFLNNIFNRQYIAFAPRVPLDELDVDKDGVIRTDDTESLAVVWNETTVTSKPVGLLGCGCSPPTMEVNKLAYRSRFPMVSSAATNPALSNKELFPNFWRTIMPDTAFTAAWVAIAKLLGVSRISAVVAEMETWGSFAQELAHSTQVHGMQLDGANMTEEVSGFHGFGLSMHHKSGALEVAQGLKDVGNRIVVMLMYDPRARLLLCQCAQVGLANLIFLTLGWYQNGWWAVPDDDAECTPEETTNMAAGFISANTLFWRRDFETSLSCSQSMTSDSFYHEFLSRQGMSTNSSFRRTPHGYLPANEAANMADAICLYAQMLHQMLYVEGFSIDSLRERTREAYEKTQEVFARTDFEGVSGRVMFAPGASEPEGSVILQHLQATSRETHGADVALVDLPLMDIAIYDSGTGLFNFCGEGNLSFGLPGEQFFAGPKGAPRIDARVQEFKMCQDDTTLNMNTNECEPCPEGMVFVHMLGKCSCSDGYAAPHSDNQCSICTPGTYSDTVGITACFECAAGKHTEEFGQVKCQRCPRGTYQDERGQSACKRCNDTLTTIGDGIESAAGCGCGVGYKMDGNGLCESCGEMEETGLECLGHDDIKIATGFFAADESLSVFKCFEKYSKPARCQGGYPGDVCAPGREGIACAECAEGMKEQPDGSCAPCNVDYVRFEFVAFVVCAFAVIAIAYIAVDLRGTTKQSHILLLCLLSISMGVTVGQQLGVLAAFSKVEWPDPMRWLLDWLQLLMFDIDAINLGCIFSQEPWELFVAKAAVPVTFALILLLVHVAWVHLYYKSGLRRRWGSLVSTAGTLFMVFYISVIALVVEPLQCLRNPNGLWTMRTAQSVICWQTGEHTAMVVTGMILLLVPLAYLAKCCEVVWRFPRKMTSGKVNYLYKYNFLFFRYRTETYWYSLVHMLRCLLMANLPSLPDPAAQIILMQGLLLSQACCVVAFRPWRVPITNVLDFGFTLMLMLVLGCASFYVNYNPDKFLAQLAAGIVGVVFLTLPAIALYSLYKHFRGKHVKKFQYFICHHKAGAGSFARLVKLELQKTRGVTRQVFIDSDNLTNLDCLFECVANMTESLIIIASRFIFMRPWCVGEITTAMQGGVRTLKLLLPGFEEPEEIFITNYHAHVNDLSTLSGNGISLEDAQDAMRWCRSLLTLEVGLELSDLRLQSLAWAITKGEQLSSDTSSGADLLPVTHRSTHRPTQPSPVVSRTSIIHDDSNLEATSAAMILARLLYPHLAHLPEDIPQVPAPGDQLPATTRKVLLVCTSGALGQERVLCMLAEALGMQASCMPILVDEGFCFPTAAFADEHRALESRLGRCSPIGGVNILDAVLDIFKAIALPFLVASASEASLKDKSAEIARRLLELSDRLHEHIRSTQSLKAGSSPDKLSAGQVFQRVARRVRTFDAGSNSTARASRSVVDLPASLAGSPSVLSESTFSRTDSSVTWDLDTSLETP